MSKLSKSNWLGYDVFKSKKSAQNIPMTQSIQYSSFTPINFCCSSKSKSNTTNRFLTFRQKSAWDYIQYKASIISVNEKPKEQFSNLNQELSSPIIPSMPPPVPPQDTPQDAPSITIPEKSVSNSSETSMISPESLCEEKIPLSLIIGQVDNGKTFIMRKIFDEDTRIELFQPILQKELKYYFVDTSSFDFDSDFDSREEQINNYKLLFNKYPNRVRSILIVVNFERTDLMKKKVQNINKEFHKFKNLYTIIVTKFHFSENVERDKEQIKRSFQFLNVQDIIFVGNDTRKEQLLRDLKQKSLPPLEDGYEFNLVDTFFQEDDENEQNELFNDLQRRFI